MISKSFIESLKHSVSIVDLIDSYVPLKKQGKEYVACCPFHTESSPSFKVNENKDLYHCFGCGEHGGIIDFVMTFESIGFADAVETIAGKFGLTVEYEKKSAPKNTTNDAEISLVRFIQKVFNKNQSPLNETLGISQKTIEQLELGGATNSLAVQNSIRNDDALKKLAGKINFHSGYLKVPSDTNALVVPLYRANKKFAGLYVNSKNEPYLIGPKGADRGLLYNPSKTFVKNKPLIISTDMLDAIKCYDLGIPNYMCAADTKAKSLTTEMLRAYRADTTYFIVKNDPERTKALAMDLLSAIKTSNNLYGLNILVISEKISLNAMVAANGNDVLPTILSKANSWHDYIARELIRDKDTFAPSFKDEMAQLLLETYEQSTKHNGMPLMLYLIADSIGKCTRLNPQQILHLASENIDEHIARKIKQSEHELMDKHLAYAKQVLGGVSVKDIDTLTALLILESKGVAEPSITNEISESLIKILGEDNSFAKVHKILNDHGYISQQDLNEALDEIEKFQVNSNLSDFMLDDGFLIDAKMLVDYICTSHNLLTALPQKPNHTQPISSPSM
ncbi:CHC2 zinc finger domain-containing protein [Shewanella aestuarii]|uniref:Zinc finger CHC2-type domain-containing protein n=1 Tax=Shewanella aestuarii TaxID=1028752 RepID=A0A6G9QS47_9GAMM|nr:CHC2 zinc finger domain-containing protein [Shewanella aestuarii]QIR16609.1 hypothetical protein HBH39_19225 [Shewanella aestuarii]